MNFDGKLDLATGMGARSKTWKNKEWTWSKLVEKLQEDHKTNETFKEYMASSRDEQSKIKDVGGYVGGYLRNGRRKPENVVFRQLMTLDIDFAHADFWDDFILQYDNAAILHATHKHSTASPRYRLIIPLSREATPDEYVAVSRKVAGSLGIELFDNTTFQPERLMFWPSTPKDVDYYCQFQDGPWVDVDAILESYLDWTDSSLWPTAEKKFDEVRKNIGKQQDPKAKKGIVGAFCKTFGIAEVLEKFLSDVYTPTQDERYTYVNGTAASGLVVYDDLFAYSHHGTDPCSGKLCNAFDIVRIHKFGNLDSEGTTGKPKSFAAMEDFARQNKEVKKLIARENIEDVKYDFGEDFDEGFTVEDFQENIDWMQELEIDSRGKYLSTAVNINMIFKNDYRLKNLFKQNDFDTKRYVFGNMPWRKVVDYEPIKNVDYSGVRNYIESIYGITGNLKIDDSMALEFEKNSFHPVRDYLKGLEWDGKKRVNTLLIDYFGCDDNIYIREAITKTLVGAVGRIFVPGIKFDLVLTLVGPQGTGKSTLLKKLGGKFFSDTFMTVQGKEALEQIQGAWIIEMAELSGQRKAEVEAVKHFISKQEDSFRPAYARASETFLRQNIFVATTNNKDFLRDPTGNRRFNPVDIDISKATKSVWNDLTQYEVDQIWAEAVMLFNNGEKLFLSPEADALAKVEQRKHSEEDERKGLIEVYLETLIPKNWGSMDLHARRAFYDDQDDIKEKGQIFRDYICVAEIWCECLGKAKEDMDRYKTRDINDILRSLEDWEQSKSTKNFKIYGKQKFYERKLL